MPCLKIVPESYVNSDALDCLVHKYIYPKSHTIGGLSVDPAHAAEQMKLVKQLWYKENGSQLLHFILAFSPWESERIKSAGELMPFAYDVCSCFADDCLWYSLRKNWTLAHPFCCQFGQFCNRRATFAEKFYIFSFEIPYSKLPARW